MNIFLEIFGILLENLFRKQLREITFKRYLQGRIITVLVATDKVLPENLIKPKGTEAFALRYSEKSSSIWNLRTLRTWEIYEHIVFRWTHGFITLLISSLIITKIIKSNVFSYSCSFCNISVKQVCYSFYTIVPCLVALLRCMGEILLTTNCTGTYDSKKVYHQP